MKIAIVDITPDQMLAVLRVAPAGVAGLETLEAIKAELSRRSVVYGMDLTLVEAWLHSDSIEDFPVAKGKPPKHGKNGELKFLVDVSAQAKFIPDSAQGATIDFRNAMRVAFIEAGQPIAEVIAPTQGENGFTVCGGKLPAEAGEPVRFSLGDGVEQQNSVLIATQSGTPSFRDSLLLVRKSLEITGDVSFKTGNIDFSGTVIIHGDVLDDFEVKAAEHIVVEGIINGAKLSAGGYIQCLGGILGKNKADLKAGGFIEARFVDSASLCSDLDIVITKDILHSKAVCLGTVKCAGSIIGGEIMALRQVEAGDIGSSVGTKTIIGIHKHYRQEMAKEQVAKILLSANAVFEKFKRWNQIAQLSPEDIAQLEADQKQMAANLLKKNNLDGNIERLEKVRLECKGSSIKIAQNLWPDAILVAPYCKLNVLEHSSGSIYAMEDISKGTLQVRRES